MRSGGSLHFSMLVQILNALVMCCLLILLVSLQQKCVFCSLAREKIVGWYHTGPKLKPNDVIINELVRKYSQNSVRFHDLHHFLLISSCTDNNLLYVWLQNWNFGCVAASVSRFFFVRASYSHVLFVYFLLADSQDVNFPEILFFFRSRWANPASQFWPSTCPLLCAC